jgi:hypothetical protein
MLATYDPHIDLLARGAERQYGEGQRLLRRLPFISISTVSTCAQRYALALQDSSALVGSHVMRGPQTHPETPLGEETYLVHLDPALPHGLRSECRRSQ